MNKLNSHGKFTWNYRKYMDRVIEGLLILFMDLTTLFGTIYGSYYTISANFYLYLQYFQ